jgi:hypothetical protein
VFSLFLSGSFLTFDLQLLIADDYLRFSTIDYFIGFRYELCEKIRRIALSAFDFVLFDRIFFLLVLGKLKEYKDKNIRFVVSWQSV